MYIRAIAFILTSTFAMNTYATEMLLDTMQSRENVWVENLKAGDIDNLTGIYEENAWLVVPGAEPFKGRNAIHAALLFLKKNTANLSLKTTAVEAIGTDYVVENGIATTVAESKDASVVSYQNYQVLWHRADNGSWKMMRDVVTPK